MRSRRYGKLLLGIGLFVLIFGYYMLLAAMGWALPLWIDALIVASFAVGLPWVLGLLGFDPYGVVENKDPPNQTEPQ